MIVLDASVVVDALTGQALATEHLRNEELAAPHVMDAEVGTVLRRHVLRGLLDAEQAETALEDLGEMEIVRYPQIRLLARAWELRHTVTFIDALYVALAERLGATLLSLDARLASAPGIRATVEVPGRG